MKRLTTIVILLMCILVSVQAQKNQKEVLLVDYFVSGNVNQAYAKMLRDAVIAGIQQTNRLTVVDVEMEPTLKLEEGRRQDERAMGDPVARNQVMQRLGANYALTGNITRMEGVRMQMSDGSYYYDGQIAFDLKVVNVIDGSVKVSKPFSYAGLNAKTGQTPNEAVINTTDYIKMSMQRFVNQNFKLENRIISIEKVNKKKAETVYIDCGSDLGITKGQLFDVFIEKNTAGKSGRQNIGTLKAIDVQGEELTLCRVTKGGEAIQEANLEMQELIVVSGKKAFNIWETTKEIMK
ncbi:hypothetical protein [Odoribacter laneus]|uniref:Curli production assembly/transport component CsgG n=1 Tax=Odoribacter laneus YIT 12061 TaxID=742817 RepID=H1DG05_9BACT|nr:hypothetical protein [Odoribacter laneus]EHP48828.1 hypothetical protein HMPREF9449_01191 [Odoribacter laneus YIT 12061]